MRPVSAAGGFLGRSAVALCAFVGVVLGLTHHGWEGLYIALALYVAGQRGRTLTARRRDVAAWKREAGLLAAVAAIPLVVGAILGFGDPLVGMPVSWLLVGLVQSVATGHLAIPDLLGGWRARQKRQRGTLAQVVAAPQSALAIVQRQYLDGPYQGGAFLGGWSDSGVPIQAPGRSALAIIGGPSSGKTQGSSSPRCSRTPAPSCRCRPSRRCCTTRSPPAGHRGPCFVFDPGGHGFAAQYGLPELRWSPIFSAGDYERATITAREMVRATTGVARGGSGDHFADRAGALLACMLHAAAIAADGQLSMDDLIGWVLSGDLDSPAQHLAPGSIPMLALIGLQNTPEKELGSIKSTAIRVMAAYEHAGARRSATTRPPFGDQTAVQVDLDLFVRDQSPTIYVVGPKDQQALLAPLVVGLLREIKDATYALSSEIKRAGKGERRTPPVLFSLDEAANIAPIPDLPDLCSEAGGQGLQLQIVLQELAQARARWGESGASLLSYCGARAILPGLAGRETTELISLLIGDYDQAVQTTSSGTSDSTSTPTRFGQGARSRTTGTSSGSSWTTRRQRIFEPSAIAQLPPGRMLALIGHEWAEFQIGRPAALVARPSRLVGNRSRSGRTGDHAARLRAQTRAARPRALARRAGGVSVSSTAPRRSTKEQDETAGEAILVLAAVLAVIEALPWVAPLLAAVIVAHVAYRAWRGARRRAERRAIESLGTTTELEMPISRARPLAILASVGAVLAVAAVLAPTGPGWAGDYAHRLRAIPAPELRRSAAGALRTSTRTHLIAPTAPQRSS